MSETKKSPSFQFYPDAWLSDMGLRACSPAARGLWADLLCLMHQGTPYGHLRLEVSPGAAFVPDTAAIARMTGTSVEVVAELLAELEEKGVMSRSESGTVYSRRMIRDEEQRAEWRERQARKRQKDAAAPITTGSERVTRDTPRDVTRDVTASSRRSSSSSPTPTPRTTTSAAGGKISTFPQGVTWNDETGEFECESAFEDSLLDAYRDVDERWVAERWEYHTRWLKEHPARRRSLAESGGLAEWVRNRIREDYARAKFERRTADELVGGIT